MTCEGSIMVVDDDPDVRESIVDALEEEGYRVASAWNGKDALRLLREGHLRPDLILLDMMMPEMDGWEFRAEQQKDPELASIPVVVFTAYGVASETALRLQAAGFLKKPVRLAELMSTVARVRAAGGAHDGQR